MNIRVITITSLAIVVGLASSMFFGNVFGARAAVTIEDTFEDVGAVYNLGDLHGQAGGTGFSAGWVDTTTTEFDITAAQAYEGTQSVLNSAPQDSEMASHAITSPSATGEMYVHMYRTSATGGGDFRFILADGVTQGTDWGAIIELDDNGDINLVHSAGYTTVDIDGEAAGTGYSADTWYQFGIDYDCEAGTNGQFRVRWRLSGGTWGAYSDWYELHADIDTVTHVEVVFNGNSTDDIYFDHIVDEVAASDTCTAPATGDYWAVALSDECHVTTDTHFRGEVSFHGSGNFVIDGATFVAGSSTIPAGLHIKNGGFFQIVPNP